MRDSKYKKEAAAFAIPGHKAMFKLNKLAAYGLIVYDFFISYI